MVCGRKLQEMRLLQLSRELLISTRANEYKHCDFHEQKLTGWQTNILSNANFINGSGSTPTAGLCNQQVVLRLLSIVTTGYVLT